MTELRTRALDSAFGHPRGLLGVLGGTVMARGNAATERQVVRLAHLGATEDVLVIGPGPGVGLRTAGEHAGHVIGVEPSERMRRTAAKRCADLIASGRVELREGTAERTGLPASSVDTVLSVNNTHLWHDRPAAIAELHRVLRPGGTLLVSSHQRWLPDGRAGLQAEVQAAGFDDVQTWAWTPPTRFAGTAAQLRARRP